MPRNPFHRFFFINLSPAMQLRNPILFAVATLGCVATASAQQTLNYNFNVSALDYAAAFSNNGPSAGTTNWFGVGGAGNTGLINNNGTQPSLVYNTPVATAGLTTFNTSVLVKTATVTTTGNGSSFFHIGFADNVAANLRTDDGVSNQMSLRFVGGTGAGELSWNTRTDTASGGATNTAVWRIQGSR
jgi:hypothetical protein